MENKKSELTVTFRFLSLNRMQSYTLQKELVDVVTTELEINKLYTGLVPLSDVNFNDIIDFYIKQQLSIEQCDIMIAIKADKQNVSDQVPNIVSQMLKHLECALRVSTYS